jgi:hypothetical protein
LILRGVSKLDVFDKATPAESGDAVGEDLAGNLKGRDDVSVCGVPDEELTVKGVSTRDEKSIVVRESKVRNLEIVLRHAVEGTLGVEVPEDNVRVVASLACLKLEKSCTYPKQSYVHGLTPRCR